MNAFEAAVRKRHSGYDPNNELCPEPATPEQAMQDLQDGWDKMEDSYVNRIVKLRDIIETYASHMASCDQLKEPPRPCNCGLVAETEEINGLMSSLMEAVKAQDKDKSEKNCEVCMMNTICTHYQKQTKKSTGECPKINRRAK